jgi:hypothetical protein
LSFAEFSDHDVAGLQIAMNYPMSMGKTDGTGDLFENVEPTAQIF